MSDGVLIEAYELFHRTGPVLFVHTAAEVYARTGQVQALAAALHVGTLIPSPRR